MGNPEGFTLTAGVAVLADEPDCPPPNKAAGKSKIAAKHKQKILDFFTIHSLYKRHPLM